MHPPHASSSCILLMHREGPVWGLAPGIQAFACCVLGVGASGTQTDSPQVLSRGPGAALKWTQHRAAGAARVFEGQDAKYPRA